MLRNARAFHTFFLGVSQVPEPRKVWCPKLSVWHSSWLCTAFFYSTAFNSSLELIDRIWFSSGKLTLKQHMGTTPMAEILNGMNRTTSQPILARASHCSNIALTSELLAVCNEPPSPVFLWCTGSCFLYWTLAWKLKRAGWIVLSLKIKKTVACLKSPQRQLIVKKWCSRWDSNPYAKSTAVWRQRVYQFHHKSIEWCSRRDSNSYAIKHQLLRLTCLPLSSQEQNFGGVDWIWTSDDGVADRFLSLLGYNSRKFQSKYKATSLIPTKEQYVIFLCYWLLCFGFWLARMFGVEPKIKGLIPFAFSVWLHPDMALSARFELAVQTNGRQVSNLLV